MDKIAAVFHSAAAVFKNDEVCAALRVAGTGMIALFAAAALFTAFTLLLRAIFRRRKPAAAPPSVR